MGKEEYDYLGNSACAQECTGLIPVIPKDEEEWEAYDEIYHFKPKPIVKEKE